MPGWSLARDGHSMVAEVTGPTSPRTLVHLSLPAWARHARRRRDGCPRCRSLTCRTSLVSPTLHRYRSHDGLPLHGWLYRPPKCPRPWPGGDLVPRRSGKPGAAGILAAHPVAGGGRNHRIRPERPRLERLRQHLHVRRRRCRPSELVPGCAGDRRFPARQRLGRSRFDRRAGLVLRRLPGADRPGPLARTASRPAPRTPACPTCSRSSPRPRRGWRRRRSPNTAIRYCEADLLRVLSPLTHLHRSGRPRCWCTAIRTPTCRWANRCGRTSR